MAKKEKKKTMVEISKTHAEKTDRYVQCDRSFADRPDWKTYVY